MPLSSQKTFSSKPDKINFAYQPIFEIETNTIYGYEALMRPAPYTPMEVIAEFARHNRLNEIEEFSTYYGAKHFLENNLPGKIFFNSFPSARRKSIIIYQSV